MLTFLFFAENIGWRRNFWRSGMSEPEKLERGLGLIEATSLNMTFMVGIGPFIVIPFIVRAMGGPQCILAWVVGAVLAALE